MEIPSEGSITLDRKAFKALASETRVEILKRLDGTQMTVSDLARDLDMNKATMFEHLEQLVEVGLVRKDTEEERATTVKTAGTEAPVQGPPKKWVYYRLTWKGKNVLHPERVKIAILLCSVVLALAIAALLYFAAYAPTEAPASKDTIPPAVVVWHTDAVRPGSGVHVDIVASDAQSGRVSGLNPEMCRVRWGIATGRGYTIPDRLNWSVLDFSVGAGPTCTTLSASVPATDWASYNGSYLLVGALLQDKAGNSAEYYHSVPILTANVPELRFVAGSQRSTLSETGTYHLVVSADIENMGPAASGPFLVGLYDYSPDIGKKGGTSGEPLSQAEINPVPSGGSVTVQLQFSSKTVRPPNLVYLMLDINGSQPDMDRSDNVISIGIRPVVQPHASEAGGAPGFGLVATVAAAVMALVIARRLRNQGE